MVTFLSVLAGGLITWFASWFYYKRAGDELRRETLLLKKANIVVAYMLEHPDAKVSIQRDGAGNPIGIIVSGTGTLVAGRATVTGVGTVADKGS
jgi:hypothetical protein